MSAQMTEVQIFRDEALELLGEIEQTLLDLEQTPDSSELVNRLFRAVHTIKGSGAMFGFDRIAQFTHHVETAIDAVRSGKIPLSKELIDFILASRDQITAMIDDPGSDGSALQSESDRIIKGLRAIMEDIPEVRSSSQKKEKPAKTHPDERSVVQIFRIRFTPEATSFQRHFDPLSILADLTLLGDMRVTALVDEIPSLADLDPLQCYLSYDIVLSTDRGENAIRDAFIFLEQGSSLDISQVSEAYLTNEHGGPRLGEILVDRGDVEVHQVAEALKKKPLLGNQLVEAGATTPSKVKAALAEQEVIRAQTVRRQENTIRVASDKLDFLINVVGELVTAQARLETLSAKYQALDLVTAVEEVGRLVTELRDNVMNIRMLPIGATFEKFKRLVRDLCQQAQKQVEMVIEGGDTELDKSMLEKLNDPLVHLIRNSVDHGIEDQGARQHSGKTEIGRLLLKAAHVGGSVNIIIQDDGAGIDVDAVVRKAVKQGVVRENEVEAMSRSEKLSLIFAPGLSTAKTVTNVSGRGVGMDVVKTEIAKLRGKVEIDSKKGEGTTIAIRLPLTMAIIDGLLVRASDTKYVIPVNCIKECLELTEREIVVSHGRHIIKVRDKVVPYVRLRELFDGMQREQEIEQIIIVEHEGASMGIVIDQIYGDYQTVIKSLGKVFTDAQGISGATILGDGTVALIVDVSQLLSIALAEEAQLVQQAARANRQIN